MKLVAVTFSVLLLVVFASPAVAQQQNTISVTKTDGISTVNPGQQTTYTITITNDNQTDIEVDIDDTLPSQISTADSNNLSGSSITAGIISWTDVSVPANDSLIFTVTITIPDSASDGDTILNIVEVGYDRQEEYVQASDENTVEIEEVEQTGEVLGVSDTPAVLAKTGVTTYMPTLIGGLMAAAVLRLGRIARK